MKKYTLTVLILSAVFTLQAQEKFEQAIKKFGKIKNYENVAIKPDPKQEYKVLMRITQAQEKYDVNKKLWYVARLYNLLRAADVPHKNIHIVAVFSGKAYDVAYNEATYKEKKKKENPNTELIDTLIERGIELHICGQTIADNNLDYEKNFNPKVKLTFSAMTDVIVYSKKDYVIFE